MGDPLELAYRVATMYVPFMFALCFHEFAHGWMALKKGDPTAQQMGRLSMNPVVHADMVGTVVLPLMALLFASPIFFGWAKPVPFNPRNLSNPKVDSFWIALAGPLSNVLLALVSTALIFFFAHFMPPASWKNAAITLLNFFIQINLFLAFFNMIPLHPLDGGKVLARYLPHHINAKLEENEMMSGILLLILILTGALAILAIPVQITHRLLINLALWGF